MPCATCAPTFMPRLNPYLACCLDPTIFDSGALDQIIAAKGLVFWITGTKAQNLPGANGPEEIAEVKAMLAAMPLGAVVRGFWWHGEDMGINEGPGVSLGKPLRESDRRQRLCRELLGLQRRAAAHAEAEAAGAAARRSTAAKSTSVSPCRMATTSAPGGTTSAPTSKTRCTARSPSDGAWGRPCSTTRRSGRAGTTTTPPRTMSFCATSPASAISMAPTGRRR